MKRALALGIISALFLGACGGDGGSDDPKAALLSAMENTGESEGLTFTASLRSTPESLDALASDEGGAGMEAEDAEKLLDSSVTISSRGSGEDGSFEMVVNVAGEDDFEMKVIDKAFYMRADVEGLVETFGGDPAQIDGAVQQAEAQGLTFIRPAAEGKWISIEGLGEASQQITGQSPPSVPEQSEIVKELTASFKENATVTSEGDEDPGEHLKVSVPLRETYERFIDDIASLGAQLPPGAKFPDISEVPNEDIFFDIWVDDDRVTQLEFDFLQIADIAEDEEIPEGVEEFAFRTTVDEFDEEIEVPEDAVAIDPQQIFGLLGSLFMGGAGGVAPGAPAPGGDAGAQFNCQDLVGAPPEVLEQFADECPELQPAG